MCLGFKSVYFKCFIKSQKHFNITNALKKLQKNHQKQGNI